MSHFDYVKSRHVLKKLITDELEANNDALNSLKAMSISDVNFDTVAFCMAQDEHKRAKERRNKAWAKQQRLLKRLV